MSDTTAPDSETGFSEFVNPEQLAKDVSIDGANLSENMKSHTALYVMYATKAVRAKRQYERYKTAFEVLEAQLDSQHRTALKEENAKTTEGQVRAAVVTDPRWSAASGRVIDARMVYQLADIAVDGFEQRKDMLLQIARDAGREQAGALRVVSGPASTDRLMSAMERTALAA